MSKFHSQWIKFNSKIRLFIFAPLKLKGSHESQLFKFSKQMEFYIISVWIFACYCLTLTSVTKIVSYRYCELSLNICLVGRWIKSWINSYNTVFILNVKYRNIIINCPQIGHLVFKKKKKLQARNYQNNAFF